ncbi:MAG: hypothetical protein AVO35_01195 [Candidatus Aegiribacteria sp. MLS_C]|nr:MAG: hypothetical protein AVO35_01195 [Candidatus Aegiribacteria sp. MLS_C]
MFFITSILSLVLVAPGDLVISEIMYNPDGPTLGDDDCFEWVELCNAGPSTLELEGMMLSDGNNQLFIGPFNLETGSRVVLAADSEDFALAYGDDVPVAEWEGDWTKLSNDGDQVILYSSSGEVLDAVTYSDTWGADPESGSRSDADGRGSSLEKVALTGPNDETNWRPSEDYGCPRNDPEDGRPVCWGTPGVRNSVEAD